MEEIKRYYEILGLPCSASLDEIKKGYLVAERKLQQDCLSQDARTFIKAQEKLNEINEARQKVMLYFTEHGPPEFSTDVKESEPVYQESYSTITEEPDDVSAEEIMASEALQKQKAAPEIPSVAENRLWNKKSVNLTIVLFSVFAAVFVGVLIGVLSFKKSEREPVTGPPAGQAAATVPVFRQATSAVRNVSQKNVPAKGADKPVSIVKQHKKRIMKVRKHSAPVQRAAISREGLEKIMQAAKLGNADAQYNLGVLYAKGIGVKKDREEAVKWHRRAANQGNAKAQEALEIVYE